MPQDEVGDRTDNGSEFLSVSEVAGLLGLTPRTVRYQLSAGVLQGRQLANRRWLVSRAAVTSRVDAPIPLPRSDDTGILLEIAMLRVDNARLSGQVELLTARLVEVERDLERTRATGLRLLEAVETNLQPLATGRGVGEASR